MEIKVDLHTHTLATPHAYCTLMENIEFALERKLEAIAITDHGPATEDAPHHWHFSNCRDIPRTVKGMTVIRGVECSYLDTDSKLDLDDWVLERLDIVIASMHQPAFEGEEFIKLMLNAAKNPRIHIMGHIGRTAFTLSDSDYEKIVVSAKENGKLVELNNHCFEKTDRPYFADNAKKIMIACKKHNVPIVVNTDAHFCTKIGDTELAQKLLKEIEFPEELVMNTSLEKLTGFLNITL
ncbi:MAG: phosphatase [Clostridia bacterium]|nr:phosphatase [Clostridia bacterium]